MYITTHVSTVFPLTATRPAAFKFHPTRSKTVAQSVSEPLYRTEIEVTRAIVAGTFRGFAPAAYADAAKYEASLKSKRSR